MRRLLLTALLAGATAAPGRSSWGASGATATSGSSEGPASGTGPQLGGGSSGHSSTAPRSCACPSVTTTSSTR